MVVRKEVLLKTTMFLLITGLLLSLAGPLAIHVGAQAAQKDPRIGPYIDRITMPVQRDYSVRLLAFEANEFDILGVLPRDLERVRTNRPDAHIIFTASITALGSLHFNVELWPVKYPEVRKAIAMLTNRDEIISKSPLQGIAIKNSFIVPPTYGKWVNPNTDFEKLYPYNPERAKQLLASIFQPCPDNPRFFCDPREGMKPVEIEILSLPEATSPTYWWEAMYWKSQLESVGIRVKVTPVSSRELDARTSAGTAQAWVIGWSFGRFPLFMYYFWHSREIRPGGWNEWKVSNATLDEILDKFYYAETIDEALQYAWKAQEILTDIIPWIPVYTGIGITAFNGAIDRDSILLAYAPPLKDPVGFSYFWWNTVRFKDKPFGGTLRYYFTVDITTLNPTIYLWATEADAIFRVYTYGYVVRPEDIYAEPRIPVLFESYKVEKVTEGGQTLTKITIKLRDGITWHDGVPITARDIEFTIKKFGIELKTRRDYGPYIDALARINVVDDKTIEFYLTKYGWPDLYTFTEYRPLPMHIYGRLQNPLDDVSLLPHPSVPGLTAMVGSGPFALIKRELAYAELVWYPEYVYRAPERMPRVSIEALPAQIQAGQPLTLRVRALDPLGQPSPAITVVARLTGPVSLEIPLRSIGGGVYEATVPALREGSYTITVEASMPVMLWKAVGVAKQEIRVVTAAPVGVPGPAPAPEVKPIEVTVGGVTVAISTPPPPGSPTAAATPPKFEVQTPAPVREPELSYSYAAIALAILGLVVAAVATLLRR
ncbi:bacterial extracellular solute-binding protein, family 5 Middle [Desulfurococcaceae archaeon AG1]|jgi:ABC-type transport system substrate-binding protein|nr:bacterial extracellular solute-binding protein, family 5 Middle [Desulfurococcaceae archaeon AG1]